MQKSIPNTQFPFSISFTRLGTVTFMGLGLNRGPHGFGLGFQDWRPEEGKSEPVVRPLAHRPPAQQAMGRFAPYGY
jgi:hypothetical protein